MRSTVAIVVLVGVSLAGCGRFQRAQDVEPTTTAAYTTLAPLATTTTGPRPGRVAPTSRPPADPCKASNRSAVDHESGFRLILDVADKVCFGQREDFTLTLQIQNVTDRPLHYDPNQEGFFDIIPENNPTSGSWSDKSCRTRVQNTTPRSGSLVLQPGATATRATALYPAPKSQANREDCRFLEGTYAVLATLAVCGDAQCGAQTAAQSPPVRIRVS